MEDMARLGEIALKLERYRREIVRALAWVIFGMVFGSLLTLANSLILFGFGYEVFWILLVVASIIAGYVYARFLRYMPAESELKRWKKGIPLMFIPLVISYLAIPAIFHANALYFNTVWYPSLGVGLFLCGFIAERTSRPMTYTGILISVTSLILLPISKMPSSYNVMIGAGLLCLSMMMFIYFITAIYIFFRAQRVIYEKG